MTIALDVMGGDNAPLALLRGAVLAHEEYSTEVILVGTPDVIRAVAEENKIDLSAFTIKESSSVITMEDPALCVVKDKKDSSMAVGLQLLKEGGCDAFVSAGNSGALHVGSSLIIRKIKGVQRAGIAAILPFEQPMLMMDSGANMDTVPSYLAQWAMMGSVYMRKIFGIKQPRVGLLNNGAEETKGTPALIETYQLLKNDPHIHFIGNVEARYLPESPCDVLVTDGFTGNVVLKLTEGLGKLMFTELKNVFTTSAASKIAALSVKRQLHGLKRKFDASEHGGAPFLGVSKPVIKAHGSSDALAIKNAVRQAIDYVNTGVIYDIAENLAAVAEEKTAATASDPSKA